MFYSRAGVVNLIKSNKKFLLEKKINFQQPYDVDTTYQHM